MNAKINEIENQLALSDKALESNQSEPKPDKIIDARFKLCPLPIINTDTAIKQMQRHQILAVRATDPGLTRDLPAWCNVQGHQFLSCEKKGTEWIGLVRKEAD